MQAWAAESMGKNLIEDYNLRYCDIIQVVE